MEYILISLVLVLSVYITALPWRNLLSFNASLKLISPKFKSIFMSWDVFKYGLLVPCQFPYNNPALPVLKLNKEYKGYQWGSYFNSS